MLVGTSAYQRRHVAADSQSVKHGRLGAGIAGDRRRQLQRSALVVTRRSRPAEHRPRSSAAAGRARGCRTRPYWQAGWNNTPPRSAGSFGRGVRLRSRWWSDLGERGRYRIFHRSTGKTGFREADCCPDENSAASAPGAGRTHGAPADGSQQSSVDEGVDRFDGRREEQRRQAGRRHVAGDAAVAKS